MNRTKLSPIPQKPGFLKREKEKFLATEKGPDQFGHFDKVLTNMGQKHGIKLVGKPLFERFGGSAGSKVSLKPSNALLRLLLNMTKRTERSDLGANLYAAAMVVEGTKNQLPHVKQAAAEFMSMVTEQNGEVLYTPQLVKLVHIIAHPEETKPQENPPGPVATIQVSVATPPEAKTAPLDPYESDKKQLLDKRNAPPESLPNMPDHARVASAVNSLENQAVAHRLATRGQLTAQEAASYLLKQLAPFDSPDHLQTLGKLLDESPLLAMVHEPVANALVDHYLLSQKLAAAKANAELDQLSADLDTL